MHRVHPLTLATSNPEAATAATAVCLQASPSPFRSKDDLPFSQGDFAGALKIALKNVYLS